MVHNKHGWWHRVVTIGYVLTVGVVGGLFWLVVAVVGIVVVITLPSPVNWVVGIPLTGTAWGMMVHLAWSDLLVVGSPKFNEGVCAVCSWRRRR